MVFDSLYDSMPPTTAEQVCALVHTPARELTMLFANVKKQHNRSDCGVYAIAYATSLCHGVNPVTTQYTGRKMRDLLRHCLLLGEITPLPSRHTSPLDTVRSCQIVEVVCHCRTQPECPMLQCSACPVCTMSSVRISQSLSVTTKQRHGNAEHAKTAKINFTSRNSPVGSSLNSNLISI